MDFKGGGGHIFLRGMEGRSVVIEQNIAGGLKRLSVLLLTHSSLFRNLAT